MFWFILIICVVLFVLFLLFADADLITLTYEAFYRFISPRLPAALAGRSMNGKVVWITGASSGIGEGLAYKLASMQCKLVLSARRKELLGQVKTKCLALAKSSNKDYEDDSIMVLPFDMLDVEQHKAMVDKVVDQFNRLDCLVNNAGRIQLAWAKDTSNEAFKALFDLNVLSQISLTNAALPQMIAQKSGHLVAISSIAGKAPFPQSAGYSGTKHALCGYFGSLAQEVIKYGIRVTLVCPGPIHSDLVDNALGPTMDSGPDLKNIALPTEWFMANARCSELLSTAIQAQVQDAWISKHPVLWKTYFGYYAPTMNWYLGRAAFTAVVAILKVLRRI